MFVNHPVPLRSTYQRVRSKPWNFFDITSACPPAECFLGILTVSSVGKEQEQVNLSGKIFFYCLFSSECLRKVELTLGLVMSVHSQLEWLF